jgi:hypothetical protein
MVEDTGNENYSSVRNSIAVKQDGGIYGDLLLWLAQKLGH